ncbi:1-acyl-sn-glycerol-3-phosphate acyltransferase [Pelolinea submarina]|uniref:Acyltransferase-like protein n=1 Tax=Pelolinea submarina TaxID=913107 RepID=A0A347ZRN6_9CHLR|nr:1-acyl-sn-glycerol-3-phosphate acyltransferase [Pelolinea submarina]REG11478.1 acyltransferase-like protein [Pelolinea submarina]BBB47967.1 hypothetical protein Pelsub_P1195 [Pelolinea submarina]
MTNQKNVIEAMDMVLQKNVERDILIEIYRAAKIPDWRAVRRLVAYTLRKPVSHFSGLIANLDTIIGRDGIVAAAKYALPELCRPADALGQGGIPASGPLVIASNHPGTYDAFSIISNLPRDDVKLIVSGIPFFQNLPHASRHFIFATHNTNERTNVIRQSIRHLQDGGALLIFPSGRLDPDPSVLPGAVDGLRRWSRSIEVFLRKVPESRLVLTITSGVLSGEYINHFIPRMFKNDHERRRITEFIQVIRQMVRMEPLDLYPKVSFAGPLSGEIFQSGGRDEQSTLIMQKAGQLLDFHMNRFYPGSKLQNAQTEY